MQTLHTHCNLNNRIVTVDYDEIIISISGQFKLILSISYFIVSISKLNKQVNIVE